MPDYFLKKKSLLDRFKDNHGRTGYIQSARAEHTWSNPIKRNRRTKELNGWIKSFAGKKHIRKLARFNATNAGRYESMSNEAMSLKGFIENLTEKLTKQFDLDLEKVRAYLNSHTPEMQELLDDKELSLKEKVLFVRGEITGEKDEAKEPTGDDTLYIVQGVDDFTDFTYAFTQDELKHIKDHWSETDWRVKMVKLLFGDDYENELSENPDILDEVADSTEIGTKQELLELNYPEHLFESKEPTEEKLGYEKGHKNSKGEDAPWVIRSHEDNRILASFANKKDAEEHMQRMKQYSKTESKTNEEAEIKDKQYYLDMFDKAYKECVQLDINDGGDGQHWADYFATGEDDPTTFSQKEADEIVGYYMEFHPNWEGEPDRPYKDWMENIDNTPKTALDKEITRILKALYAPNESKQTERQDYAPYYFCRSKYPDGELAVLADGDSIHYLPSYNIKGFKDKIDYGTIATSFEPIENPETSELHKIVQRKDGRNIIALTQAEFDDFAENNGWGGRDKWFKDILRNRHIIESNDTRERAVDDYDTLTDGLSELGFVPSSDIRNGMIYPYRSRFTATKDGVKYHFWIHEDPSGEYTDYIEVWGGKFTTNGDPEDPEATKFNTVSDVLDNLKSVKKSEAMAGKHESKDVSLKEIARTLDTAINKDGNYSVKDNTSGVTATDKDRTQTIKVSKDLKVELEDTNGKHSYEAQSLRDLSKYIRRAVKGEYVNEDFHKTQVKDAVYDVINRHNLNNAVKVSYLGNSVVCKYADRTLRIQPDLLTTMSTKDGDNVDTYPTNLKELDGYLDRVFGHYADELAESKQSEGLKLDYVDTITVPQWLWEAYLLGNEYGGDLTDDEQTILYDFKEKYKDCHLDDRGEEPDFHSRNDFDCYGGNCYVVDVYTKTDVKEKKSEKLFNKQELEALARGADILDQLQYRFSFSFYSPKTYTDAVDTALAMDAEDDKRIAHETIGDSEFRLYTDDPYDAIRFRDGLSNRAGIPAEDLASTFRSAVGIRKNGGFATEDEQDAIGRYAAENYVSFSVSEDNSTMYVEGELPNVVEFFEAISSAEPA